MVARTFHFNLQLICTAVKTLRVISKQLQRTGEGCKKITQNKDAKYEQICFFHHPSFTRGRKMVLQKEKQSVTLPKSAGGCCVVNRAKEASCRRQVCSQSQRSHGGQVLVRTGWVGKFDCDWVDAPIWYVIVQLLNGTLCLYPLVKADKSHTLGQACNTGKGTGPSLLNCYHNIFYWQLILNHRHDTHWHWRNSNVGETRLYFHPLVFKTPNNHYFYLFC